MEDTNKEAKIKEVKDEITKSLDLSLVDNLLLDNKFEFEIEGVCYRVCKPTFNQKQELYKQKLKKFNDLLKDENILFEKDLKDKLKAKNIDIYAMEESFLNLEKKKKSLQLKLGELLVEKVAESELKVLKEEIIDIVNRQNLISIEKSMYLDFSLENQLLSYLCTYLACLITEKKVSEDKWERVWNSYEDFEKCNNEDLLKKAAFYTTILSAEDSSV